MKKFLITVIIAVFGLSAFSQKTMYVAIPQVPVDSVTKKITYTEVIQQQGTKDSLYNRALHWCNTYFKNSQDVTKIRDKEDGKVQGIYRVKVYNTPTKDGTKTEGGVVSFTFTIECKDNKYRYKVTDFNQKGTSYYALEKWFNKKDPYYNTEWDNYLVQVDQYMQDFCKSLKKGMMEASKRNDNW